MLSPALRSAICTSHGSHTHIRSQPTHPDQRARHIPCTQDRVTLHIFLHCPFRLLVRRFIPFLVSVSCCSGPEQRSPGFKFSNSPRLLPSAGSYQVPAPTPQHHRGQHRVQLFAFSALFADEIAQPTLPTFLFLQRFRLELALLDAKGLNSDSHSFSSPFPVVSAPPGGIIQTQHYHAASGFSLVSVSVTGAVYRPFLRLILGWARATGPLAFYIL